MKKILVKCLWGLLILFLLLLLGVVIVGMTIRLDWPWWVALCLVFGLFGFGLFLLFLRKILRRRREQRFVNEIVAQDEAAQKDLDGSDRQKAKELQNRWMESVQKLKKSQLRHQGNPLYVLPWYLIIGESGSGKTTAITSADLSSPFADLQHISGFSGTKNCDWWFFEQAIILDVAGRYAIPIDEGRDRDEWQHFLKLLVRYRKKEPLNGLIVTLSADKVLQSSEEQLREDGKSIRARINELMRVLGATFPVYLLLTKCDLIMGMDSFCKALPEKSLDQAMGVVNTVPESDPVSFAAQAVQKVADRLKDLRLLAAYHENKGKIKDHSLLIFPDEFKGLEKGIQAFVQGAFAQNPFQETPQLRGVYFSSGRQEGTPFSHLLHSLDLIEHKDVLPGTSRGLFLHDFFAKILPGDRDRYAPTQRFLQWRNVTRNIGLVSWVVIVLALCGLLSFSFLKNLGTIHEVSNAMQENRLRSGDLMGDIFVMDRFRKSIIALERSNQDWWIPRFGLDASLRVEDGVKQAYWKQFQEGFLRPFDSVLEERMTSFSSATQPEVIAEHVDYLTRRVNLLKARLEGASVQEMQEMKQPDYEPLLTAVNAKDASVPEVLSTFSNLYLSSLNWRHDQAKMNTEMNRLQAWLERILDSGGQDLHWLTVWAQGQENLEAVLLSDFWKGNKLLEEEPSVSKAFTSEGHEQINGFLHDIESALKDPLFLASRKAAFQDWYEQQYLKAWQDFGQAFDQGRQTLAGRDEWRRAVSRLGAEEGPYQKLLNRLETEMEVLSDFEKDTPEWIPLMYAFDQAKQYGPDKLASKGKKVLGNVLRKGKKLLNAAEEATEDKTRSRLMAGKAYKAYMDALDGFSPLTASTKLVFEVASKTFQEDQALGDSPFFKASQAIEGLKQSLGHEQDPLFWNWLKGPLDLAWHYALQETGCYLQQLWKSDVLAEVRGATDRGTINKLLLGQDGFAWQFVKGQAGPFLDRDRAKGYYPKERYEGTVPFHDAFLSYINQGAVRQVVVKDSYRVQITALPVKVNQDARYQPHAVRLTLQCADQDQTLVNLMFPVEETFIWTPATCGDVILEVDVQDAVLTRHYTGDYAFPRFLREFNRGLQRFGPEDFEGPSSVWKRLGLGFIELQYKLQGHRPAIRLLGGSVSRPPQSIAECW